MKNNENNRLSGITQTNLLLVSSKSDSFKEKMILIV